MNFRKRQTDIARLKLKHGRDRSLARDFPNLSCRPTHPSYGDGFAPLTARQSMGAHHPDAREFPVGNLHKQGPVLVTPGDIAGGQLRFFGGGKPNHMNLTDKD